MRKILLVLLVGGSFQVVLPVYAQHMNEANSPCAKAVVTSDLIACFSEAKNQADAQLDSTYASLLEKLSPTDAGRLRETQTLWVNYREANCSAERALYEPGTASAPAYLACLGAMARSRTKELQVTYVVKLK